AEYAYGAQLLKEKKGAEAEAWLLRAKEHGINSANETLGELYFNEKKYKEAYPLLTLAKSANSKYQLAVMFERGLDVIPNYYRAYISYQEAYRLGRKGAKTDMARVGRLKSETEQAHFDAAERIDSAYQKELIERCGEKTTHLNIRTGGERVYLHGLASFPFEGANGFLLHTPEGEVFYVIDTEQQTDIKQFQYVDVSAITTGNALIISGDDDSTLNLYQLYFQKQCQP
ncbi:MAG: hypothetical protein MUP09_05080, partial [Thiovulaceae bacterium]|nr:hypothetical protein [Sulfurimonadaceae bacterium]